MRWIRPAAQSGKSRHVHAWNPVLDFLSSGEDVGIVEANGGAVQKMRLIDWNMDIVLAGGQQNLIHFGRADGPHVVDRVRLVRPVEELWCFISPTIQWLVLPEGEVHASQAEPLVLGKVYVDGYGVLPLVLRVLSRKEPVLVSIDRGSEIGQRIRL